MMPATSAASMPATQPLPGGAETLPGETVLPGKVAFPGVSAAEPHSPAGNFGAAPEIVLVVVGVVLTIAAICFFGFLFLKLRKDEEEQ